MSARKKVAVITRTKNRTLLLKRALDSVSAQTFKDFVWVIVNDAGERPPVEEIAAEARRRGIETQLLHRERSVGMEAASNEGVRACDSEYIVIHDDDDSWDPAFLERTTAFLDREPLFAGVITHTARVNEVIENGEVRTTSRYGFNTWLKSVYLMEILMCNSFPPISFLYKRSLYDALGGYDESLPVLGDWDFNIRFLMKADVGVIREELAHYHFRETITDAGDGCGNSVVAGMESHIRYDAILRNRYFRTDPSGLGMLINLAVMTNWQNSKANEIASGVSSLASREQEQFGQSLQKQELLEETLREQGRREQELLGESLQKQELLEETLREQGRREQELLGQVLQKCERKTFFDRVVGKLKRICSKK